MRQNKYNYLNVIQQNYAGYWEDVSEYEANSAGISKEKTEVEVISKRTGLPIKIMRSCCSQDFKEYQLLGYPTRIIFRKELNTELIS